MMSWVLLLIGLTTGGIIAWLAGNSKSKAILREVRAQAENLQTTLEAKEREIGALQGELTRAGQEKVAAQTELRVLQDAEKSLANTFDSLAGKALRSNNQAFLELARSVFDTIQAQAKGDLDTRQKAIDGLVAPLKESLLRYEQEIQQIEKSRQVAYGSLGQQLKDLQGVTRSLDVALRTPKGRGSWGELTLRRVVELAGMSDYCDFSEQKTLFSEGARQRPDMVVNLPGGRRIAIDAKAPLDAFREAASASTDDDRNRNLALHSQHVRAHMNELGGRSYWEQLDPATDFVVLFLPGEAFFSAALEQDGTLIEDSLERGVILATPTTLIALLRAVAYGWRQEQATRNAQEISERGKELYDRIRKFVEHFEGIGSSLRRVVDNYNQAAASFERRVMPSARRLQELGAASGEEMPAVEAVDEIPRALAIPDREDLE